MAKLNDIAVLAMLYSEGNEGCHESWLETVEAFSVDDCLLDNIKDFLLQYVDDNNMFSDRDFLRGIDEWFIGLDGDDTTFYLGGYYGIQLFTKKVTYP